MTVKHFARLLPGALLAMAGLFSGCQTDDPYIPKAYLPTSEIVAASSEATRALLDSIGRVNMTALQKKLDSFDAENSVDAYFTVTSSASGWNILYGSASGEELYGTVYKSGFANGFDAINYALKNLPERSAKYKVLVDSDLHSGDASSSDGSSTSDSNVSKLYSISMPDYAILDFNGHTLYADNTSAIGNNSAGDSIIPVSITRRKFVSLRNLTIKGQVRYAIWCQGSDNVVFDNIRLELGGTKDSKNLGLRIAEKGNDWSTNIYVDNIYATGCYDNAVETMKVDGIFIGTVNAVDNNDCGLLLNTTTNAVVGIVNGTRCSPRSANGVYAALRTANYVGPDVYIHQINAESCGRGYFCVSANAGISIDEINSNNSYSQGILVQDGQNLLIRKGSLTAGSNTVVAQGLRLTNGSLGGTLATMSNRFENITISGFSTPIYEDSGESDWNEFIGCTTDGAVLSANSVTTAREKHKDSSIIIASDKTEIADGEFMNYTEVTEVTIPAGITKIGKNAFYGCTSLKKVTFEDGSTLSEIGDCAFGNTAVESITFPASVKSFGSNIMSSACKKVVINSTEITSMGTEAFFTLADPSEIEFANPSLYSGHTYSNGSYGSDKVQWVYWYGHTRTTVK